MAIEEMIPQELRDKWRAAVEEIAGGAKEIEQENSDNPHNPEDDTVVVARTKVYAGKCNSLLSYVKAAVR